MVRTRKVTNAKASIIVEPASFSMIWPDELETTLIKIMWRYIEGRKLADNVFKKLDFALIVIEL